MLYLILKKVQMVKKSLLFRFPPPNKEFPLPLNTIWKTLGLDFYIVRLTSYVSDSYYYNFKIEKMLLFF